MLSQSRNYFTSKTRKIRYYTKQMYKEINQEFEKLMNNFPEDGDLQSYMIINQSDYNIKINNIIDKYEDLILKERSKHIEIVGSEVSSNVKGK